MKKEKKCFNLNQQTERWKYLSTKKEDEDTVNNY